MCLAAFSYRPTADYPFVLAANRDEFHERPTAAAAWWADDETIFGGRDLVAGGSWLATDRRGRLAAVTNFREGRGSTYPRSRGHLVRDYLSASLAAGEFIASLEGDATQYGPFNLVLFDGGELHYVSNRVPHRTLEPGVHALSNTHLGANWPKTRHAEAQLAACLENPDIESCLFDLLTDETLHAAAADRATRLQSTIFIRDPNYGTRSSTVVLISRDGVVRFAERRFRADGTQAGESAKQYSLDGDAASD